MMLIVMLIGKARLMQPKLQLFIVIDEIEIYFLDTRNKTNNKIGEAKFELESC